MLENGKKMSKKSGEFVSQMMWEPCCVKMAQIVKAQCIYKQQLSWVFWRDKWFVKPEADKQKFSAEGLTRICHWRNSW